MLLVVGLLVAVLLVRPLGGRLHRLGALTLSGGPLLLAALVAQVLALAVLSDLPRELLVALHGASYVLAGVFVWRNRAVPGLWLIALGSALNALVLALNGGTMPASAAALRRAGIPLEEEAYTNSEVLASPVLAPLGDVLASPTWLPFVNVFSVGDVLLLTGAVWTVHRTCRTVLARDPRPAWRRLAGGPLRPLSRRCPAPGTPASAAPPRRPAAG